MHVRCAGVVLAAACAAPQPATPRPLPSPVDRAWRQGPRDSALASAMACELVGTLDSAARRCAVVGYRETSVEYVLRVRRLDPADPGSADGLRLEVRLPKQGDSATVEQLAIP